MLSYIAPLVVALALAACSGPAPGSETPEPPPDTDWCEAAEKRLETLECRDPRGDPMWVNRDGERFAATCRMIQEQGAVPINPRCIAQAETCEEADTCPPP